MENVLGTEFRRVEERDHHGKPALVGVAMRIFDTTVDGIGEEHLKKYGPGATGVGWDLALHGLKQHLGNPAVAIDPAAFEAWTLSSEGKAFVRSCGEAWGEAYIATGASPDEARAQAERTIAFYTGI